MRPLLDKLLFAYLDAVDISYSGPKSMESSWQNPPKKDGLEIEGGNYIIIKQIQKIRNNNWRQLNVNW